MNMASGAGIGAQTPPAAAFTASQLAECSANTTFNPELAFGPLCTWQSDITQRYHTYIVSTDWRAIPNKLDFRFEFLAAFSSEANNTIPCPAPSIVGAGAGQQALGTNCNGLATTGTGATLAVQNPPSFNNGQFPTEKNNFLRFSATSRYTFDPTWVRSMGFNGAVVFKLRYIWERNQNTNWASDNTTPYLPTADTNELTGGSKSVFLAYNNPNYTAQIIAAALAFKW